MQLGQAQDALAAGHERPHELMREQVLRDELVCRQCRGAGRVTLTAVANHIISEAVGGTDDRKNYQRLCDFCRKVHAS